MFGMVMRVGMDAPDLKWQNGDYLMVVTRYKEMREDETRDDEEKTNDPVPSLNFLTIRSRQMK